MSKNKYTDESEEQGEEKKKYKDTPAIIRMQEYLNENYIFRLNTITFNMEFRQRGKKEFVFFDDKNKSDLLIELKSLGFSRPKEDLDIILSSSGTEEHNPINQYFEDIPFKGTGFIDKFIEQIILEDLSIVVDNKNYNELFSYYFRKWLYACYNCFMGYQKNDVMLILIGAQGKFKTSFLNYLCPKDISEYNYTGHINPVLSDYNTATYLTEKIFINVDDQMETIFGKDYNSMKSIISQDFLPLRKLYKANHKRRMRIANFCGSVNEPRFLRDSNNRRYLCFLIKDIKPTYSNVDINSMWAEVREEVKKLNNNLYLFNKQDFSNIDEMNDLFHSPSEESEAFNNLFELPNENNQEKTSYFLQSYDIMKILRQYTGNNQLREYQLATALRKLRLTTKSVRLHRFNKQPRNLYELKLLDEKGQYPFNIHQFAE